MSPGHVPAQEAKLIIPVERKQVSGSSIQSENLTAISFLLSDLHHIDWFLCLCFLPWKLEVTTRLLHRGCEN